MSDRLVFADPDWRRRLRAAGLATSAALRAHPAVERPVALSRTSRTEILEIDGIRMHRKIYVYPRPGDFWRGALRGTLLGRPRAAREWHALLSLRSAGLPAIEPVALGIERRNLRVRSTVLVTRSEERSQGLDRLLPDPIATRAALRNLARVIARAHGEGHRLGRPALRDILVVGDDREIRLLDLPRHRRCSRIGPGATADDLSRLAAGLDAAIPIRDCLRALLAYGRDRGPEAGDRRALVRGVGRASRRHRTGERGRRDSMQ